jgi:hypothetical protein
MDSMTRRLFIFDDPDRFVAGTLGEPGDRAFYLQARKGGALVSVGLEKVQVAALAQRLDDLLEAVDAPSESAPTDDAGWRSRSSSCSGSGRWRWRGIPGSRAIVIEAQTPTEDGEYAELPDEVDEGPDLLRVRIDAPAARSFVRRAEALVASGRPACPFCGQPLDSQGHFCPRGNGHLN